MKPSKLRAFRFFVVVFAALAWGAACTSVLGDFELDRGSSSVGAGGASTSSTHASSSSSGGGQGGGIQDAGPPPSAACAVYCKTVMDGCTGSFQQYTSLGNCYAVCAGMESFTDPDLAHVDAGPDGGCPDPLTACKGECVNVASNPSHCGSCNTVCPKFWDCAKGQCKDTISDAGPKPWKDTLSCHQGFADKIASDKSFCPLAGPAGYDGCASACDAFCDLALAACPTAYDSRATCMNVCNVVPSTPPYDITQKSGETMACRMYWLTQAAGDPTLCPKITLASDVCRCDEAPDCTTCIQGCALGPSSKCGPLFMGCLQDSACNACSQCFNQCSNAPDAGSGCLTACAASNPDGCSSFAQMLNCVYCDQCTSTCASEALQNHWMCK